MELIPDRSISVVGEVLGALHEDERCDCTGDPACKVVLPGIGIVWEVEHEATRNTERDDRKYE